MDILRTKLDITHSITVEEASTLIPILEASIDSLNERYVKGVPSFDTGLGTPDKISVNIVIAVVSNIPDMGVAAEQFLHDLPGIFFKSVTHTRNPLTIAEVCAKVELNPDITLTILVHFGL